DRQNAWRKVRRLIEITPEGHWIWHGTATPGAGGRLNRRISLSGHEWYAQRVVMDLTTQPVPPDRDVVRTCQEPRCVAPEHHVVQAHTTSQSKVSPRQVQEIRALW